jgi:hypothetical protein
MHKKTPTIQSGFSQITEIALRQIQKLVGNYVLSLSAFLTLSNFHSY